MGLILKVLGFTKNFSIETKLFHLVLIIMFFAGFGGGVIELFRNEYVLDFYMNLFTMVCCLSFFIISRFFFKNTLARFAFIILSYIFIIYFWYSRGDNLEVVTMIFLVVVVWQLIFAIPKSYFWLILNIVLFEGLMVGQYLHPEIKRNYEFLSFGKFIDISITYFFISLIIFFLLKIVLNRLNLNKKEQHIINQKLLRINSDLERVVRTQDRLISVVSHDLRSPLSGIINLSDDVILEGNKDPEKLHKYLDLINQSAKNIDILLENLLMWTRLQNDTLKSVPDVCNIWKLVDQNLLLFRLCSQRKDLDIQNALPEKFCVFADLAMVDNIIRNLISNAIKFTPRGGKIEIFAESGSKEGKCIFAVEDNGIGISEDRIKKILEGVNYDSRKGTEAEKGNGIGLYICKKFAEANKGRLDIKSKVDKGSAFYVTLPAIN